MGCNGGVPDFAFQYDQYNGLCTEESYKYFSGDTGKKGTCQSGCDVAIPKNGVTGFKDVDKDERALMDALNVGPVAVAIEADKMFFQHYGGGVLHDGHSSTTTCGDKLDHAVLAVGYGYDADVDMDYWLVKNSWNTTWGDQGYIKMAIVEGNGICGVQMEPEFPTAN